MLTQKSPARSRAISSRVPTTAVKIIGHEHYSADSDLSTHWGLRIDDGCRCIDESLGAVCPSCRMELIR